MSADGMVLQVGGAPIQGCADVLRAVAHDSRTMARIRAFDLPGPGDPNRITFDDVRRTRAIGSMVSNQEAWWFEARSADPTIREELENISVDATLADADPMDVGGLFDRAERLRALLLSNRSGRIGVGKLHEVLHLKRPALVPLLNSRVLHAYKRAAQQQAAAIKARRMISTDGYWAAVRCDIVGQANAETLARVRNALSRGDEDERVIARLTDVRLLDLVIVSHLRDI